MVKLCIKDKKYIDAKFTLIYNINEIEYLMIFRDGCNSLPAVQPASRKADPVRFRSRQ